MARNIQVSKKYNDLKNLTSTEKDSIYQSKPWTDWETARELLCDAAEGSVY